MSGTFLFGHDKFFFGVLKLSSA